MSTEQQTFLRRRDGHHARVTYEELFFDLVYVFAVTQLSHQLLHNLSIGGLIETIILWFAVWLGWQYRAGPGCLNRFSASISGASAGVRLPSGLAAG